MLTCEYMSYDHLFVMKVDMKVFHCSINPEKVLVHNNFPLNEMQSFHLQYTVKVLLYLILSAEDLDKCDKDLLAFCIDNAWKHLLCPLFYIAYEHTDLILIICHVFMCTGFTKTINLHSLLICNLV